MRYCGRLGSQRDLLAASLGFETTGKPYCICHSRASIKKGAHFAHAATAGHARDPTKVQSPSWLRNACSAAVVRPLSPSNATGKQIWRVRETPHFAMRKSSSDFPA